MSVIKRCAQKKQNRYAPYKNPCSNHGDRYHGGFYHADKYYGGLCHDDKYYGGLYHADKYHNAQYYGSRCYDDKYYGGLCHDYKYHDGFYHVDKYYGGLCHDDKYHADKYHDAQYHGERHYGKHRCYNNSTFHNNHNHNVYIPKILRDKENFYKFISYIREWWLFLERPERNELLIVDVANAIDGMGKHTDQRNYELLTQKIDEATKNLSSFKQGCKFEKIVLVFQSFKSYNKLYEMIKDQFTSLRFDDDDGAICAIAVESYYRGYFPKILSEDNFNKETRDENNFFQTCDIYRKKLSQIDSLLELVPNYLGKCNSVSNFKPVPTQLMLDIGDEKTIKERKKRFNIEE